MTADTLQWHQKRREGLGGSDIATMLGCSRFSTPLELWKLKTGRNQPWGGNEVTRCGTLLEPYVLQRLAAHTRCVLAPGVSFLEHERWAEGVRIQVNTDGHLLARENTWVAEAKTAGSRPQTLYLAYWLQVQTCMLVSGCEGAWVGCLYGPRNRQAWFDGWRLQEQLLGFDAWFVEADPVAHRLIEEGAQRWWRFVEEDREPEDLRLAKTIKKRWGACASGDRSDRI